MDINQYTEIAELDTINWWYASRKALVKKILAQMYSREGGTALDLGCGTGAHADLLRSVAGRTIGVDPSDDALRHAAQRGYDSLLCAGAEALPLPDGSIELVLATDVLEHVQDVAAVSEIKRVLATGGTVLVTVPAFMSLWHSNDDHSHHLRRYSREGLRALFEAAGFEISYLRYWNRLFFIPVWLMARFYTKSDHELRNNLSNIPGFFDPLLTPWMRFENTVCSYLPLPFGVSLVLVATKK